MRDGELAIAPGAGVVGGALTYLQRRRLGTRCRGRVTAAMRVGLQEAETR